MIHNFRVATYNIHKGFSHFNRRLTVHDLRDRLRHLLQEHGLAGTGRGHDQCPLPLAQRRQQVHDAGRHRLLVPGRDAGDAGVRV